MRRPVAGSVGAWAGNHAPPDRRAARHWTARSRTRSGNRPCANRSARAPVSPLAPAVGTHQTPRHVMSRWLYVRSCHITERAVEHSPAGQSFKAVSLTVCGLTVPPLARRARVAQSPAAGCRGERGDPPSFT